MKISFAMVTTEKDAGESLKGVGREQNSLVKKRKLFCVFVVGVFKRRAGEVKASLCNSIFLGSC